VNTDTRGQPLTTVGRFHRLDEVRQSSLDPVMMLDAILTSPNKGRGKLRLLEMSHAMPRNNGIGSMHIHIHLPTVSLALVTCHEQFRYVCTYLNIILTIIPYLIKFGSGSYGGSLRQDCRRRNPTSWY